MLWAVPVCSGQYRYCPEHTGSKNKPVLPRAYRYCPEHTGTVQSIPVLPKSFILQAVILKRQLDEQNGKYTERVTNSAIRA